MPCLERMRFAADNCGHIRLASSDGCSREFGAPSPSFNSWFVAQPAHRIRQYRFKSVMNNMTCECFVASTCQLSYG